MENLNNNKDNLNHIKITACFLKPYEERQVPLSK